MSTTLFCVICGEPISERRSLGRGMYYPLCKKPECLEIYQNLKEAAKLPIANKKAGEAYFKQKELERHNGFCGRCGKPIRIDLRNVYLRHGVESICKKAPTSRNQFQAGLKNVVRNGIFRHKEPQPKPRIYLKPWQDPQSLFCDTEFLETKILYKKIRTGEECKDKI